MWIILFLFGTVAALFDLFFLIMQMEPDISQFSSCFFLNFEDATKVKNEEI